jgi:curved DNA-binding protein CbpA
MTRPLDPWRTLELPRDATLDEVKAAYRRLAKRYHPDSAGEAAVARFLAVQAAYEALTEGPARLRLGLTSRSPRPGASARPGAARPSRPAGGPAARAAGGGGTAARPAGGSAAPGSTGRGSAAGPPSGGGARTGSWTDAGPGSRTGSRTGSSGRPGTRGATGTGRRGATRKRAKPGSTSYDDAQFEPFEPSWEGASWYGESSGTYWTLNPKEFADPRKHGPEYQARARSARAGRSRGPEAAGARAGAESESEEELWTARGPDDDGAAPPLAYDPWQSTAAAAAGAAAQPAAGWTSPRWSAPGSSMHSAADELGSTPASGRFGADVGPASASAGELVALGLLALGIATLVFVVLGNPVIAGLEPTVAAGGLASIVVAVVVRGLASRHSPG